jgi:hypothetical protein
MTTITLQDIRSCQTELAELIARFEAQSAETTQIHFPESLIELRPGEHYAGLITGRDGEASYHLVLMADEASDITWKDAGAWAMKIGGHLPTRREQALLYANCKPEFKPEWYWSAEVYEKDPSYAWLQDFCSHGYQFNYHINSQFRARAVRRLPI